MDNNIKTSKYKNIADSIIKIENNFHDNILKIEFESHLEDNKQIINIIKYLNSIEYKNYKFNQYSVKKNENNTIIIFNYISPTNIYVK